MVDIEEKDVGNIEEKDVGNTVEKRHISPEIAVHERDTLVARCVAQAMKWRLPPKWTYQEWREELRSQAYLSLMEAIPQYDKAHGVPFAAYLWQKIIAGLLKLYRQEWRHAHKCPKALQETTKGLKHGEIDFELICFSADVECAISYLSAEDRQLLQKVFWEGYTETEIALTLKISQRAVNKRKKRALKALANLLEVPVF